MATAHIEANKEDIAKIVLTSGDPKRCEFIAKNYLKDIKLVNDVRGMTAYTGTYKNKRITIFPSGMGIPSMGIYSYELFTHYNVDYIIRIGTIGAYNQDLKLGDVIITNRAYSDSSFAKVQSDYKKNYLDSDDDINKIILKTAEEMKLPHIKGNIFTSDVFYEKEGEWLKRCKQFNVLGVEMETFGLLQTAKICNKKATSILTVSNSFCFKEELSSEEREKNLNNMIELALKSSLKL